MSKKLYVGNLPFSATEQSLGEFFATCGEVDSTKIIIDRETGRSKGFGFVTMVSDEGGLAAISKFNQASFEGRSLTVNEAKPMEPREGRSSNRY